MMTESQIEKKVCQYAVSKGALQYKFSSPSRRSVPDRMFIIGGRVAFIEFKKPGGKLTKMQEREINKLADNGCLGAVIDSVETGKCFIDFWIANVT